MTIMAEMARPWAERVAEQVGAVIDAEAVADLWNGDPYVTIRVGTRHAVEVERSSHGGYWIVERWWAPDGSLRRDQTIGPALATAERAAAWASDYAATRVDGPEY